MNGSTRLEMFGGPKDGDHAHTIAGRRARFYDSSDPVFAHCYITGAEGWDYRGMVEQAAVTQEVLPLRIGERE